MKNGIIAALAVGQALAGFDTWSLPEEGEVRGPCPMLNTLANHGFLPHSGRNITQRDTKAALFDALHIDEAHSSTLFEFAITTNPDEHATTFDLDHLGRHNILEHDASLSRVDHYFGDQLKFSQRIFDQTKSFFTGDKIDIEMAAKARIARIRDSEANNPEYELSELAASFSFGESVAYIIVLGDVETATVEKDRVEFLFEQEKLPLELGWERPKALLIDLGNALDLIQNVTANLDVGVNTSGNSGVPYSENLMLRGGLHIGKQYS